MAIYRYQVLNADGREQAGSIEAIDARSAANLLRARQLHVLRIEDPKQVTDEDSVAQYSVRAFLPVRLQDRVFFFRQMALMLRSGLTILQALQVASGLTQSVRMSQAIIAMSDLIKSGDSLSQAMREQGRLFSTLAIQLVRSAESSGELDTVLERITEHLEQQAETRRNLITSMIYPVIVVLASVTVAFFLLTTVIPKFAEFFARSNKTLPPVTQMMLDFSNAVTAAVPYILIFSVVTMGLLMYTYRLPQGRLLIDRSILRIPVIGSIITRASIAQMAWAMSMLLRSGVTLIESLRVSQELVVNLAIRNAFTRAAEQVLEGRNLADSLKDPVLPDLFSNLAAVGEQAGSLEQVMHELGSYYSQLLQVGIKRMSNMIEPLLMLVIGGMVGFVYYAFFQAVFSLAG